MNHHCQVGKDTHRKTSAGAEGVEPSANRFKGGCSTVELHPNDRQLSVKRERVPGIEPELSRTAPWCPTIGPHPHDEVTTTVPRPDAHRRAWLFKPVAAG
jgi:hypothetical protein